MKVDLGALREFPAEVTPFEEAKDLTFSIDGVRFVEGVEADLSIQKTDGEYFVFGKTEAEVDLICARCLEPARYKLEGDISLIALGTEYKGDPSEVAAVGEETVRLGKNDVLELDEFVREALLAEIPLKPLCAEECKGLCPRCGKNRNLETCSCDTNEPDTRWSALTKLK